MSPTSNGQPDVAKQLDALVKAGAVLLTVTYGIGFLIVTIFHARYGIGELDFLRVRFLTAGACFLFLTALPALSLKELFGLYKPGTREESPVLAWKKMVFGVLSACCNLLPCFILTWLAGPFLFGALITEGGEPHGKGIWLSGVALLVALPTLATMKLSKFWFGLGVVIELGLSGVFAYYAFMAFDRRFFWLMLWFYFSGIGGFFYYYLLAHPIQREAQSWHIHVLLLMVFLTLFARGLYPKIEATWGGGKPIAVRLLFNGHPPEGFKDSTDVLLLEETEYGFYVALPTEGDKSYFLRRDLVLLVEFKAKKSPLP